MSISCIIIEDEPLALERIKSFVLKVPFLNLIKTFNNGLDALMFLKSNRVDLIFLDINIGEFTGIHLLETTNIKSQVIITTAYQEYALKGYELNVIDYLMKPFPFERFFQAIEKVRKNLHDKKSTEEKKFIFVKTEYRLERIFLDDILFIEGMRDYRRIHALEKRIMTLKTFSEFEIEIPKKIICRVHKSYMVSLNKIESIERNRIRIKDAMIPISETYKKQLLDLIS